MFYESTRNSGLRMNSMEVIKAGLSMDGGLFVPEEIPLFNAENFDTMADMTYMERALKTLGLYLDDYNEEDLQNAIEKAYGSDRFDCPKIAPVVELGDNLFVQELWHGPTYAFKDMALQLLPHLLTTAISKTGEAHEVAILVATSGDTGKAALEGFKDVVGTRVIVFYPDSGVSPIQKLQMVTQEGDNLHVIAIEGNFDDAQTGVKAIFNDGTLAKEGLSKGIKFSSANSINCGRLVPQIVYYVSAYVDLVSGHSLAPGEEFNVVVPTGNFGNILAAYYAKKMGVPIGKLICASNSNNVLTDFIRTGVYNRKRDFRRTISPSMDILISSNLERLLYEISQRQDYRVREWMEGLHDIGEYRLDGESLMELQTHLWGGYAEEAETREAIRNTYDGFNYIMDPHTAVGKWVYDEYCKETGDNRKTLLVSTASPFKFPRDVLSSIKGHNFIREKDDFEVINLLSELWGRKVPRGLKAIDEKPIIHNTIIPKNNMKQGVMDILELEG